MSLQPGVRLGPYEIQSPLGAGGMGEVYRAKDTRLDRSVAIKVLPSHLSDDAELKQRFEREARAISSLSHAHICALHDVGSENGVEFLVMELLGGETLTERMAKGTLPLAQALRFGVEIAEALGAAHRQGIVHRDLKPGNVMLTKSGVKLLDFGLAKEHAGVAHETNLSRLETTPVGALTGKGVILGTVQYMAPEQLEGKEADSRTDIFALGDVLYEMVTGRKAFAKTSSASLIGAILNEEPPAVSTLQTMAPPALDHVVRKCLAKDPDERWQSAADVASELRWIAQEGSHASAAAPVRAGRRVREAALWTALILVSSAALALWFRSSNARPQPAAVVRASIVAPEGLTTAEATSIDPHGTDTISPDGRFLVFPASSKDRGIQLWIRPLDAPDPHPLRGTEQASYPFWSPDSTFVGYFAGGKLKTVAVAGGEPVVLADAPTPRGGAWSRDGTILFAPNYLDGLYRVAATGGAVQPVTHLDPTRSQSHRFPCFLPDARHYLYYSYGLALTKMDNDGPWDGIYLGSLDGGADRFLARTSSEAQVASSRLLFMRRSTLLAVPFDTKSLAISGEPVVVAEDVDRDLGRGKGGFTVSQEGTLAYHPGARASWTQLAWLDRSGRRAGSVGEPGILGEPELSPDGKRASVSVLDSASRAVQVWIYDLANGTGSPFTFGPTANRFAIWSSDESRLYSASDRNGAVDLYVKAASGAGDEELIYHSENGAFPTSCSRDGRFLAFTGYGSQSQGDVWVLSLSGERKASPLVREKMRDPIARFSPDSRWVAYNSTEAGREEIFVAALPGSSGRWQVSTGGGALPRWRSDGKELYFVSTDDELMAVDVRAGTSIAFGTPKALFKLPPVPNTNYWFYDVAPDGERFLVTYPVVTKPEPLALILNWTEGLKK